MAGLLAFAGTTKPGRDLPGKKHFSDFGDAW